MKRTPRNPQRLNIWKDKVRQLKTNIYALALAYRDPRVPLYAKVFAAVVVAYAFTPIDLIPDFIPIFGYLDDLILVPLGITLALKMIPPDVMAECRERAAQGPPFGSAQGPPFGKGKRLSGNWAAVVIVLSWLLALGGCVMLVVRLVQ